MEKYKLREERKQNDEIKANEVRIQQQGKPRNYISYAVKLLTAENAPQITIKAMGRAISKTITVAEIIKRRVPGLHQITELSSVEIVDVYDPLEEGLDPVENVRSVSCVIITLSKAPLDNSHPGYQPPLPVEEVIAEHQPAARQAPARRGRSSRGGRRGRARGPPRGGAASGPASSGGNNSPTQQAAAPAPVAAPAPAPAAAAAPPAPNTTTTTTSPPNTRGGRGRGRGGRGRHRGRGRGPRGPPQAKDTNETKET